MYDFNYMAFWKRQSYGDRKKDQWLPEVGREKKKNRAQRIFRTMKLFCMILQWWIQVLCMYQNP